ncbi:MAG: DUF2284 domain-containing protein [Chloroflexi bacterium]|nr:DUF2284 domain-containing protein [Chloroflexota bacterium]
MNRYQELVDKALSLGAIQAKVLPAGELVVEHRVPLKCRFGCPHYGHSHSCPPRVPTVDEFLAALAEYRYALLVAFPSRATLAAGGEAGVLRLRHDPQTPAGAKEATEAFFRDWEASKQEAFTAILELERSAFAAGEPLALALRPSRCTLCAECNVAGPCQHPTRLRFSPEAVGVNLAETCLRAGMDLVFPFQENPSHIGIVLLG